MNFQQLKCAILQKVAAHDGKWYWYQLDRAILWKCPELSQQLVPAIKELEVDGLILITPNPEQVDFEVYWITEQGPTALAATDGR